MQSKWQYFPFKPMVEAVAIYRRPYNDEKLSGNDTLAMERLCSDGSWVRDPEDKRMFDQMRSGWLDYQDEISEEEVARLFAKWQREGWPDVPRYSQPGLGIPDVPGITNKGSRVASGEPCPQSGYWFTPAASNSRRYFKEGTVMPKFESDYGDTIWQWSDDQSDPKLI